ncbi:MAG: MFS transporter [Burkholderiales bacterium]|nr:MFS transporter [Burkholderiales bacterium]
MNALAHAACARYGLLGLPLAFVAMPLYVVLPQHYGQTLGVSLSALGAVLLLTRLADAFIDPVLGRWADRLLQRPRSAAWAAVGAVLLLGLGFALLFFPPVRGQGQSALLAWCAAAMVLTFLAYSLASVLHLAWGTRLGGDVGQRSRLVAWREGFGLFGVLMANVLATQAGLHWTTGVLWGALALGAWALLTGPRPAPATAPVTPRAANPAATQAVTLTLPWRGEGFRRLIALFLVNGIASAIPATLVLFFIQDRLVAQDAAPLFLGLYFLLAALGVPWWVRLIGRIGPMRAWALGMLLSLLSFVGVLALGEGDRAAYLVICLTGGFALGADLTAPGTLLTGVVQRSGHAGQAEGAYAGWWQWATKLNLALAAGLALPALEALGYTPGARSEPALTALTLAYGGLPLLFKSIALVACWRWRHHPALG